MRTCGWIRDNEIFDFSFHGLTEVVEEDSREYSGKSTVRTWSQRLGLCGGQKARPLAQTDLEILRKSGNVSKELPGELPHPFFSAEETGDQKGSDLTKVT